MKHQSKTIKKLGCNDYNFHFLEKIQEDLQKNLASLKMYAKFMSEYDKMIVFLNSHNESEMRATEYPLYDKLVNSFVLLYQFLPYFTRIAKQQITEDIWKGIFEIFYDMKLKDFLQPSLKRTLTQSESKS